MNPIGFIDNFEHIVSARNGVQQVRGLILQLAVEGRLVNQDTNDKPAKDLLNDIQAKKKQAIREGIIRTPKSLTDIQENEKPFQIPRNWEWTRLGEFTNYGYADKAEPFEIQDSDWVLDLEDIEKTTSRIIRTVTFSERRSKSTKNRFHKGDVLFGKLRPYLDKVIVAPEDGYCTTEIVPIRPYGDFSSTYLRWALKTPYFLKIISKKVHGMKMPRLGTESARAILIPVPPLSEQKRIAKAVNRMFMLCDRLEAQQSQLMDTRRRASEAALGALFVSDTQDQLAQNWGRLYKNFRDYFSVTESIKSLKKIIYDMAVIGKLVPQSESDEPAKSYLTRLEIEKSNLTKNKKRNSKTKPATNNDIKFFGTKLPNGWATARLEDLSLNIHYGYTASADPSVNDVRLLRITDIQDDKVAWEKVPGCEIDTNNYEAFKLADGDILIARTGGTIGKTYLVENIPVKAVFASYLIRVILLPGANSQYLKLFTQSQMYWNQLFDKATGTGQPNVNATSLKSLVVFVPPINEQVRIIKEVTKLIGLCEELEGHLHLLQETQEKMSISFINSVILPEGQIRQIAIKEELGIKDEVSVQKFRKLPRTIISLVEIMKNKIEDTILAKIIKETNEEMDAKRLWQKSGLSIDEFYATLNREIDEGFIAEPAIAELKLVEVSS